MVECGNYNIAQKRDFEARWVRGEFAEPGTPGLAVWSEHCRAAFQACNAQRYGCVSVRMPQRGLVCQGQDCLPTSWDITRRLEQAGIRFQRNTPPGASDPKACIGIRTDLGGSTAGALCLQQLLGEPYQIDTLSGRPCSRDGWAYIVYSS